MEMNMWSTIKVVLLFNAEGVNQCAAKNLKLQGGIQFNSILFCHQTTLYKKKKKKNVLIENSKLNSNK